MNQKIEEYLQIPLGELFSKYGFVREYLAGYGCEYQEKQSIVEYVREEKEEFFENLRMTKEDFLEEFRTYLEEIQKLSGVEENIIDFLTILPGHDKNNNPEAFEKITLHKGSITALVGKTGSGKSRLLEDIEWVAAGDTPTGRQILLNGRQGERNEVGRKKRKMIAQLSQNMNFVLDMSVEEFLRMHTACFSMEVEQETDILIEKVFQMANELSGEPFEKEISINRLSGGQSRALMIADCAILSESPVILIDEIENAGINRRRALELLTGEDKIVIIATHDPVLALLSNRRLVIDNGGIREVIENGEGEKEILQQLEQMDAVHSQIREQIRNGKKLFLKNE